MKLSVNPEEQVLTDLVNALIYEDFMGLRERSVLIRDQQAVMERTGLPLAEGEGLLSYAAGAGQTLCFRVKQDDRFQSYRLSGPPLLLVTEGEAGKAVRRLGADELMRFLAMGVAEGTFPNLEGFCEELRLAVEQTALSLQAPFQLDTRQGAVDLIQSERYAALRDRPFHPTSRVKNGWDADDYSTYGSEFGHAFGLDWVAVKAEWVRMGCGPGEQVYSELLTASEQESLHHSLKEQGVSPADHCLIPVHPWQMKHVIPHVFARELAERIIIPVESGMGKFIPSSSVRSLIPVHNPTVNVKVPIGVYALGALRIMPPRYLENGVKGQKLVEFLCARDPQLAPSLAVCNEEKWMAFTDPNDDPFADKPGHLGCLVRRYPQEILEADVVSPMSAFAVVTKQGESPLIAHMLKQRQETDGRALFRDICHAFIERAIWFAKVGVLPELHGQNVVLLFKQGQLQQLLLRDHDTVRLHPSWMERAELPPVPYTVKPNTRNTLILETPADFLSYFQTLGIQVNLASILEAFVTCGVLTEDEGWRVIRQAIVRALAQPGPAEVMGEMNQVLLAQEHWPVKEIIAPLLRRQGSGGGSMPSGLGKIANPLRWEG
ncbi:IucA/IucC family protein [Laceyella putida]|uniref:IucA/IucC family protein n=1 Tax=Laceyella putida TaxID=110101 RepID=A0ABW2RFK0_9BACL